MNDPIRSDSPAANAPLRLADEVFPIGAHLVTPRRGYTHHGIYVGDNKVVHYAGWSRALLRGPVEEASLAHFADGREVSVRRDVRARYSPDEVVARARSRLGEDRYRLTTNNCEHFCEWCLSGESRSAQVERLMHRVHVTAPSAARLLRELLGAGINTQPGTGHC